MESDHFEKIETLLSEALSVVIDEIDDADTVVIQEFIDVGEYGLAYERLWDSLPLSLNPEVREKLRMTGNLMGYED